MLITETSISEETEVLNSTNSLKLSVSWLSKTYSTKLMIYSWSKIRCSALRFFPCSLLYKPSSKFSDVVEVPAKFEPLPEVELLLDSFWRRKGM